MTRTISMAIAAALLAFSAPGAANSADYGDGARARGPGPGYGRHDDRCQQRFARCTKWFAGKEDYCGKRLQRCEMRMAERWRRHQRHAGNM